MVLSAFGGSAPSLANAIGRRMSEDTWRGVARMVANDARSGAMDALTVSGASHWSPYDRVGVVNFIP